MAIGDMKKDVFKHEERYLNWKKKVENANIKGVSKKNSNIIKKYIFDVLFEQFFQKKPN